MAWVAPTYSKTRVDAAGREFVDPQSSRETKELALVVINNWRSSHSFPLNTFQVTLRDRARRVEADALIAQRVKRLTSIEAKLLRFEGMKLSRMQDIGGCRAVLGSVGAVDALVSIYRKRQKSFRHELVREDDYLRNPKNSGYRGVHLVYRYTSERNHTYNGLQIEVQLRTRLEHAWATAVETVGTFIQQALKSSQGEDEWLRFFSLMGSEIAIRERTPTVPGTPTKRAEVRAELRDYARKLEVVARLRAYSDALNIMENTADLGANAHYFLLELDGLNRSLTIYSYEVSQLARAAEEYQAIERAIADKPGCDAVLVSAESLTTLRRAYPNYFLDTTEFLKIVEQAVGRT